MVFAVQRAARTHRPRRVFWRPLEDAARRNAEKKNSLWTAGRADSTRLCPSSFYNVSRSNKSPTKGISNHTSQVIEKELRDALLQHPLRRWIADAVAAPRKGQHLDVLSRFDEAVDHSERVREVHVVVAGAVGDKQFALELRRVFYRRRILISFLILLRQAEVAFGVDAVVVAPVRDRAAGKSRFEIIARFEHCVQRHVAPVAPSPDADAILVNVRNPLYALHALS